MLSKKYAVVEENQCVACGSCVKECPKEAITIWRGCYAVIDKELCAGCGKCAKGCPANSINIISREV